MLIILDLDVVVSLAYMSAYIAQEHCPTTTVSLSICKVALGLVRLDVVNVNIKMHICRSIGTANLFTFELLMSSHML